MKNSIKLIVMLLFVSAFAKAQSNDSYQSLMMKYFEVSGIDAEYNSAYDGMMKMFKDAYQTQDIPATVWQKYDSNKSASIAKLKGILASEYRSIFDDKEDLRNLIKFYTSSAGMQLKSNPNAMSESDKKEYEAFRVSITGTKLFGRMDRLNKAKENSSVYWSRELFCQVTGELKQMGYTSSMPMGRCN